MFDPQKGAAKGKDHAMIMACPFQRLFVIFLQIFLACIVSVLVY